MIQRHLNYYQKSPGPGKTLHKTSSHTSGPFLMPSREHAHSSGSHLGPAFSQRLSRAWSPTDELILVHHVYLIGF